MASLGQELKEEREARNISIEEIAAATKIVPRYLEALEADRFEIMPGGFFIKGIIRTYAQSIGLNEEEVMAKYRAAGVIGEPEHKRQPLPPATRPAPEQSARPVQKAGPEPPASAIPKPEPEPPPPPAPKLMPEPEQIHPPKPLPNPAELLSIKSAPDDPKPALLKRTLSPLLQKRFIPWAARGAALILLIVVIVVLWPSRRPGQTKAKPEAPVPAATEAVLPPPQKAEMAPPPVAEEAWRGVTIEISFQAETWIQVYADGILKVDGLFTPGAKAKAQADERILIHVGNAGGFTFLLNGKPARPLGRSGQVITDIKITPENFKDFLQTDTSDPATG